VVNKAGFFVVPAINRYYPFAYPKFKASPLQLCCHEGKIWMLPIDIETYDLSWPSVKNMIDSAIRYSKKGGVSNISILLLMFRDGNMQHLKATESLLHYLILKKGYGSVTLDEAQRTIPLEKAYLDLKAWDESIYSPVTVRKLSLPTSRQDVLGLFENFQVLKKRMDRKR
jgi:hypothetical protein